MKKSIPSLYNGNKKTLKDVMKKEGKKGNQEQTEDEADLTPQKHERALKEAYKSFVLP